MVSRQDQKRRTAPLFGWVLLLCLTLVTAPATAQVNWKRVGTVTTLTNNQLCKTDGTNIICDTTTPTISSSSLVGIGTTTPRSLLSIYGGGLAVGSYAATTTIGTGSIISSGNLGIGTSFPLVTLDLSKRTDALALPAGTTSQEPASRLNGMIHYNSDIPDIEAYIGGYWTTLTTGGSGASIYLGTSRLVPDPAASASDTQTGLYTAGAGKIDISSIGTQILEVSSTGMNVLTGNLGIGTTAPTQQFEVVKTNNSANLVFWRTDGRAALFGAGFDNSAIVFDNAGTLNINGAPKATILSGGSPVSGSTYFTVGSSGLVGIGTTSPALNLSLGDGITARPPRRDNRPGARCAAQRHDPL